ncbi:uncharacterized protein LOC118734637 [Rhagoletis pomonella]|uniref:uncharacterized protein LOC118734637 n=1 Tax=Rhagoletis pomonella TaxID=28610 RepID=UPI0017875D17|nr:uncharacterized protein LOC118734637 [Rhagoletis pomonella]
MKSRVSLIGPFVTTLLLLGATANEIRQPHLKNGKNVILQIVTPEEMNKILNENPDAVEMTATRTRVEGREMQPQGRAQITYTLGTARAPGDRLVSTDSSTNDFNVPTTLTAKTRYPSSGTGAVVTYVQINVYQSNDNGRAYVTSGGIGSTHIAVAVEAVKTYYFDFYSYIYGK